MSSASAPISMASAASATRSPALRADHARAEDLARLRVDEELGQALVAPERRARGRTPPTGTSPFSNGMPCAFASRLRQPDPGDLGIGVGDRGDRRAARTPRSRPAMTSAATLPSCVALCASIGSPTTSPMAKMCGTFVRSCASTGMKPRSSTATPACLRADQLAVGPPPDGEQDAVEGLRLRRVVALERHGQAVVAGLDRGDLRRQVDRRIALLDALLQRPDEVAVGAGHEAVEQLDDRDLRAERVVDRRHLQADDPAADDEQPPGDVLQRERAGASP